MTAATSERGSVSENSDTYVFESGLSIEAVISKLKQKMRANCPVIKVATVFYKDTRRKVDFEPDWFVEKSNSWIVFPHEVEEMTWEEITESKGENIAKYYKQNL
jgi:hypoxanthine phosphoribosyltransferase